MLINAFGNNLFLQYIIFKYCPSLPVFHHNQIPQLPTQPIAASERGPSTIGWQAPSGATMTCGSGSASAV